MKIISMTATFGGLDQAHLDLSDGLNLITAPNEGGKSTWAAFLRAMLYGLDTRDRDRRGHLGEKTRYQPWSGAPMEGELRLLWQGQDITLRRGPRGAVPFGSFSAVYTNSGQPVPQLTPVSCGEVLTGVGREVYERSAFIGGELAITPTPELEKRIAAIAASGQEDVSFAQVEARLREWRNRRKVNRSVGRIPQLERELVETESALARMETGVGQVVALSGEQNRLEQEKAELEGEQDLHRRLEQQRLDRRFAQAQQELDTAQEALDRLEQESARFGRLPDRERLKRAQGELQYIKVLDEEIRRGEPELDQAQRAHLDAAREESGRGPLGGLTPEEARDKVDAIQKEYETCKAEGEKQRWLSRTLPLLGLFLASLCMVAGGYFPGRTEVAAAGLAAAVCLIAGAVCRRRGRQMTEKGSAALHKLGTESPRQLQQLLEEHLAGLARVDEAAARCRRLRQALDDSQARRENSRADLLDFVHTFAPEVNELFGCSAALSRALSIDHELALARQRAEDCRLRRDDLAAQGGRPLTTLEEITPPQRSPEDTDRQLALTRSRLEAVSGQLNRAVGEQNAMGDSALLTARAEELHRRLDRLERERAAIELALEALVRADNTLRERFSPRLNREAGKLMARLTGGRYPTVTLDRDLEGQAASKDSPFSRSALALSRGTADQLYLAVRLAVYRLALPQRPPIVLDDALAAFDDGRMALALELLQELAGDSQILLFSCQGREARAAAGTPGVHLEAL